MRRTIAGTLVGVNLLRLWAVRALQAILLIDRCVDAYLILGRAVMKPKHM